MAMLSKAYKPDNFELHNPLKICFTNIWGLRLNFDNCESFFVSNSPVILAPCETNLDDSINSGNFSVRGYRPLIRKDFSTHAPGLAVYVKEGFPFARDLSQENSKNLLMFLTGSTSFNVLLLLPLSITLFVFAYGFWLYFI